MPKVLTSRNNFNCGEWSPTAAGRFDQAKYPSSLNTMENFLPMNIGGALFRPGSYYAGLTKNQSENSRLMKFSFSTTQNYIVEVGDLYFRFWANNGQVISGTPVTVVTPYLVSDIFILNKTQDADTMYITSQAYPPYKLQRTSATTFTMTVLPFIRGPFLDANITKMTITPSSATGNTTLTATVPAWGAGNAYVSGPDSPDYVTNGGSSYKCLINHVATSTFATDLAAGWWVLVVGTVPFFVAGHVGGFFWINAAVVKILTITNGLVATGAVQAEPGGVAGNIGGTTAYTAWQEGAFSTLRGHPATCAFHQQRLFFANTPYKPQNFWGSVVGAYENFSVDVEDDSAAVGFQIVDEEVNAIRWMASSPQSLQIGTTGGTFSATGNTSAAMSGTNPPTVNNDTNFGVAQIQPEKISSYLYYVQWNLFQIRELYFNYLSNRQIAADMNKMADHILRDGGGAVQIALQQSPDNRLWVVRKDGEMAVLIRNPEEEVMGWCRVVSGSSAKGAGKYESVAIISTEGGDDQIWVIVRRIINGSTVRFVEYFTPEKFVNPWDANRLDASLTYDDPKTITDISTASNVVVTAVAHGFDDGDQVKIDNVVGLAELNTNLYYVADKDTNTFALVDEDGDYIDGSSFEDYISGGEVRKTVTSISGLDHFEGEYVSVQADGVVPAAIQQYLVTGGAITLAIKAATVHVGLRYNGTLILPKLSEGGHGRMRKIYECYIRLYKTLGLKVGRMLSTVKPLITSTPGNPLLGHAPELFTGDIPIAMDGGWSTEDEIVIYQDQPLPACVLACVLNSEYEMRD